MGSLNIGADAPLRKRAGESGAARAVERDMAAVLGHPPEHDPEKACPARDAGECRFSEKIMLEKRCGCSSMVEQQPSKLNTRVRFPSPAPAISSTFNIPKFHSDKSSAAHSARGGVTRFQHPWKINSGSYSGHICARPRAAESCWWLKN